MVKSLCFISRLYSLPFVKCSGLRWLSLMLLTNLPWLEAGIVWALPFLTVLCPSEKFYTKQGKKVKKLTDFARQMIIWLGRKKACLQRPVYLVGDGSFATLQLFQQAQQSQIGMIARMKLNARLYELPSKPCSNKPGPKPTVGERLKKWKNYSTIRIQNGSQLLFPIGMEIKINRCYLLQE